MSDRTIVAMPGDGIGKVVLDEAIRVLDKAGFNANYVEGDIGWEFWCSEGNPLPTRTLDLIAEHKIGLFGAITSKPKDEAFDELSPELKGFDGDLLVLNGDVPLLQEETLSSLLKFHKKSNASGKD